LPESFAVPPQTLTPPQRKLLWIAALIVAATRLFAMAGSPWDWDEVQFMAAVREYDVGRHHPHPAGFPVFILLANAAQLFGLSDFRSLQVVSFLAACSLFPIAFLLARELRLVFRTSLLAALLFVFFPNIWYFGGTVFSDITGTALALAAMAMLLRGCRDGRSFLAGCALTGIALGVRPHSGFILLAPLLVATWHQRRAWPRVLAGAALTASITFAAYLGAALASESVAVYVDRTQFFQKWVHDVDSFVNPLRPKLRELAPEFLFKPMGAGRLSLLVTALCGIGLAIAAIRREAGPWVTFATFAPYMLFAWLMHDPVGIHRYATAYVALHALLAAYALERLTAPLGRLALVAHAAVIALVIVRYAWWTYPAIAEVRSTVAPTHAASTLAQRLVPKGKPIWIDDSMTPWATYYLADRVMKTVGTPSNIPADIRSDQYFLTEGWMDEPRAAVFVRPRGRVAEIHPPRHFEAALTPVAEIWRFGEGWSDPEGHLTLNWRWMSARSVAEVPAPPGRAKLILEMAAPRQIESADVEVRLNGQLLERFPLGSRPLRKEWIVEGRASEMNVLELATSRTINLQKLGLGTDDRDFGLRLFAYEWQPLR
jgi:hypothetical protein